AEALGTTDLNGGALFNAEFGIRHRGSTVPERSGVALSFCRRPSKLRFSPQDPTQTYALRIFALPGGTKTPIFQPEQLAEGCIRLPLPISEIQGVNPWVF
ncbi:hypothetical protein VST36_32680, partial [Pseudomonas aeruginosa]